MKATVLQENLAQGLSIVSRAVSSRSTLPVLQNVLVATDEGRLRLSATNLEIGITCWIGAKIEEEGATTVPARTFADLVSTLPKDQVQMDLSVRTQTLHVQCATTHTDIKCIDAEEFPPMPAPDMRDGILLNVTDLKEMIRQVVFAASTDEARPVLTGVYVRIEGDQVEMAAADGFRLSVRTAQLSSPAPQPVQAIIPARALSELARILGDGEETVTLLFPPGRGQVVFRSQNVELVSQLIEGTYPDFHQIIPRSHQTRTVISTQAFLNACKQAEIFARDGTLTARLNIVPGDELQPGQVTISAQSEATGSNETVLDANIEGAPILIAFNVRFLREALDVIPTPNVALETTSSKSPGVLRPLGEEGFLHVIMPMRI